MGATSDSSCSGGMLAACSAGGCEDWLANKFMSPVEIAPAQMRAAIWRITRMNGPGRYSSIFIKRIPSGLAATGPRSHEQLSYVRRDLAKFSGLATIINRLTGKHDCQN